MLFLKKKFLLPYEGWDVEGLGNTSELVKNEWLFFNKDTVRYYNYSATSQQQQEKTLRKQINWEQ